MLAQTEKEQAMFEFLIRQKEKMKSIILLEHLALILVHLLQNRIVIFLDLIQCKISIFEEQFLKMLILYWIVMVIQQMLQMLLKFILIAFLLQI